MSNGIRYHVTDFIKSSTDRQPQAGARHKSQLGPLSSIFRSKGNFLITPQVMSPVCMTTAAQIARSLYQYFFADCEIVSTARGMDDHQGNAISISVGKQSRSPMQGTRGIRIGDNHILIERHNGGEKVFDFEEGMGAIFLNPLPNGRLQIIVWGLDELGLRLAARLFPMLTGVGQPEFIVVRKRCGWEGATGVLAMGSFTNFWKASEGSFIL